MSPSTTQPEPPETIIVKLTLSPMANPLPSYVLGRPSRAAALILDNDLPRPPCVRLPDGVFNVCIPVNTNACFRVEAADTLAGWVKLCTIPINEGAVHFLDPDGADLARRFYRITPDDCDPAP